MTDKRNKVLVQYKIILANTDGKINGEIATSELSHARDFLLIIENTAQRLEKLESKGDNP